MAEYQNIFTQVQVQGPPEMGVDGWDGSKIERGTTTGFSKLAGWFGNAQLGPVYLGSFGMISLAAGLIWFVMVGLAFWEQAGYNAGVFMRDLFYLSLDPPSPIRC